MAYVGNQPVPQATQTRDRFVATSGQTSFATSGYTPQFLDVYLDGVKLDTSEFTATNGSDVVLNTGATTGQILEVVAFSSFDVADIRNMTQPLGLKSYTTTERNALSNIGAGDTIYNSTTGSIEFYDGTNWIATNLIPTVNSVTGTIYSGFTSTLALSITNATDTVTVRFAEGGVTVADVADVAVSSGSASVSVPASVYGQTAGDTISVSILNQDGTPSSNSISKTVLALPSGGSVSTSGSYRIHTFTSSSSFVVPTGVSLSDVEYLVVAGGGGGGFDDSGGWAGGAGAGGYRCSVAGESSGANSSAETRLTLSAGSYTVTVGAGGSGVASSGQATNGANSVFGSITSTGGGAGANTLDSSANSGGSGGGGQSNSSSGASGTSGQGTAGGSGGGGVNSGGGGGAGGAGGNPAGGIGLASSITGVSVNRAGGGGGATSQQLSDTGGGSSWGGGSGGTYGDRNGDGTLSDNFDMSGDPGTANTGGGGGGSISSQPSGNGGSGIVIVRYQLS